MSDQNPKICFDRVPSTEQRERSIDRGYETNLGRAGGVLEAAALNAVLWNTGATLPIAFMDGDAGVQAKVQAIATQWTTHANINFDFSGQAEPVIRISFQKKGSWSYLGSDALGIPEDEPTMNFGWLKPDSEEEEYQRVVLHEFGHALGLFHEHQNPTGGIQWNRDAVIASLSGPPNYWGLKSIEQNMFETYDKDLSQYTKFDPESIMLYSFPSGWTQNGTAFNSNSRLSQTDIDFIRTHYPGR